MGNMIYRSKLGCIISPYRKGRAYQLEKNTGTYDKVYHKYVPYVGFILPYRGQTSYITYNRNYDDLHFSLPRYEIVDIPEIVPGFMTKEVEMRNVDSFREAQTEVIGTILNQKENEKIWFVNLQTGQGKTILAVYLSTVFKMKTWIMCFSDDILHQWDETYLNKTNIDPKRILRVNGQIIDAILDGRIDPSDFDVFMCTPTLLDRFGSSRADYGRIDDLFRMCKIGLLIYDEAHKNVSNLVKINAVTNIRYHLYLSADFGQGNYEKEMMYKAIFRNTPVLTPSEELQKSLLYTKIIVVGFNSYPTAIEENEPFNKYGYSAELYMKYQFKKGVLIPAIIHVLNTIRKKDSPYRSLILFNNISNVDDFTNILREEYPDEIIGRYHGSVPKAEREATKEKAKIIVATYSSFSTGLDVSDIKYVLSTNQCNKVADNQSAGRARPLSDGSDAMYFMFVDNGFAYCKRKLKIRLAYLTETKSKDDFPYYFPYHPDVSKE